jgi:hypothetical protein
MGKLTRFRRHITMTAVAVAAVAGLTAAGTGQASASTTNGENIVVGNFDTNVVTAVIIGTNYLNQFEISTHLYVATNNYPVNTGGWAYDSWDWFKGELQINWYDGNGNYLYHTYCYVPDSKSGNGTYWGCSNGDPTSWNPNF